MEWIENDNSTFIKKYLLRPLDKIDEKYKCILYTVFFTSLLTYWVLIITGVTCPDGICEGLTYYTNADWASSIGRWAIRYLNCMTGNVVIPVYTVTAYCLSISLVVLMLTSLFKIKKRISIITVTGVMIASPSMIGQFLYTYMALAYGVSCLLSSFFVWILYQGKRKPKYILAIISLAISLGLYQSYIGFSILLIVMLFAMELSECISWKTLIKQVAEFAVCGISGCVLYLLIMKIDLKFHNLSPNGRMSLFNGICFSWPK